MSLPDNTAGGESGGTEPLELGGVDREPQLLDELAGGASLQALFAALVGLHQSRRQLPEDAQGRRLLERTERLGSQRSRRTNGAPQVDPTLAHGVAVVSRHHHGIERLAFNAVVQERLTELVAATQPQALPTKAQEPRLCRGRQVVDLFELDVRQGRKRHDGSTIAHA